MRSTLLLFALIMAHLVHAQRKLDYGVNLNFNALPLSQKKNGFSTKAGFGLGLFNSYRPTSGLWGISTRVDGNRLPYFSENFNKTIYADVLDVMLGFSFPIPAMDTTIFRLHAVGGFSNISAFTSSDNSREILNSQMLHNKDLGLNVGIELPLSRVVGLELSYTHKFFGAKRDLYYDAQPNDITLSLNIHFNNKREGKGLKAKMAEQLEALSKDTLYVVNEACSDKMTNELLSQLFDMDYNFSAFKVINSDQVDSVKQNSHPLFYAFVGPYYGGQSEPLSKGIYLMDSDFELTKYPYPFHTNYYEALVAGECFDSVSSTRQTIRSFNRRLHNNQ